jgi:Tol biopolymer transport system component
MAAAGGEPRRVASGSGNTPSWSPDGRWLAFLTQGRLFRVQAEGGEPVPLSTGAHQPFTPRVSPDGRSIYYSVVSGPREQHDLWKLSLADGAISRLTKLEGQHGRLGYYFAADARYLYFTWYEDDGDIWVMDVVTSDHK